MPKSATLIIDNKSYDLQMIAGTDGPDVIDVRALYGDADVFTFDPGFTSTASCESKITYIDGDKGILLHRGYNIEDLAAQSSFLEVCYLLLLRRAADGARSSPSSSTPSPTTRCCTRSSIASSEGSARTPTRWRS